MFYNSLHIDNNIIARDVNGLLKPWFIGEKWLVLTDLSCIRKPMLRV